MARQSSSYYSIWVQAPRSLSSIPGWHFLAAVGIFTHRYESMLSRYCSLAIVMLWFVSFGTDWLDHLVFGYLLQDLIHHERDTEIGNHFTINIAATLSVHAAHKLFPAFLTGSGWTLLTFFSPLIFDNAILQVWMQRQFSRLARLDRDLRRLSLMLVERSLLIVSSFSHSSMSSLTNAACWLCYEVHAQIAFNRLRNPALIAIWWHSDLCQSITAASALFLASNFWFLAKSISPSPSDHRYSKFTGDGFQFRVLLLYPRLTFWPIRCSLVHVPYRATVWYEAMSYTWGDGTKTETILLDGCTKKVTRSVYEMLARKSSIFMPKLLWIDGLCIDQDNEEEKKSQVTFMDKIYSNATLVTVFLGMSTSPSEHERRLRTSFQYRYDGIFGVFGDEGARLHYQEARLATDLLNDIKVLEKKFKYNDDDDDVYKSLSRPNSREQGTRWENLLKLLQHPWFERVWVVQEVALAKCVRIVYGDEVIIWDRFVSSLKTLQKNRRFGLWLEYWHNLQFRQHSSVSCINRINEHRETFQACSEWSYATMGILRAGSTFKLISDHLNAADMKMVLKRKDFIKKILPPIRKAEETLKDYLLGDRVPPNLSQLLADGFYFKATDPRDLIYGLMAICSDPLEIDYAIPVDKVYLAATKAVLEKNDVNFLLYASGISNRRQINPQTSVLPSWVPDWRSPLEYKRLIDQGTDGKWTDFTAGGTLPSNLRLIGESTLALSGLPVDSVERLWTLSPEGDYQDSKGPFASMFGLSMAYFKILSELLGPLENSDMYLHVHPPQSLLEAFRRTLVTDKKRWGDDQTVLELESLYAELEGYIGFFGSLYTNNVDAQLLFKAVVAWAKVMEPVEASCAGRQFFTSKNGYFGLCPPYTLKEDLIYVVPGVYAPIALRRVGTNRNDMHNKGRSSKRRKRTSSKKLHLVGECYVHGLMRGEALSLGIIQEKIEIT